MLWLPTIRPTWILYRFRILISLNRPVPRDPRLALTAPLAWFDSDFRKFSSGKGIKRKSESLYIIILRWKLFKFSHNQGFSKGNHLNIVLRIMMFETTSVVSRNTGWKIHLQCRILTGLRTHSPYLLRTPNQVQPILIQFLIGSNPIDNFKLRDYW